MAELTTDAFGTTSELDPSAFGTTPTEAKKPEGDYLRGLKKYAPQMQEMYGAGKALAGKAIDSESLIKSGIATMQDANRKVQEIGTKPTDEWTGVNSVGDAIDWAQHGLGQVTGNLAESAVAAGAGTLLGGLGANPLTAAAGGVTGLLGKSIVKGALKDQAEAIAAKYGAQEAEKFIAKGMAEDVAKKTIGRTIGQNVGIAGMAGFHGVGETGSRAFQEAGYDPSQVELGQVLPRAAGHAAAEFLGDKILLGGMLGKGAYRAAGEGAYPMVKTVAGNMAIVAGKEIPVELVQTVLERDAAKLELMSPEARDEYINTVAQTFLFGIAGAPAGVRSYLSGKRATEPLPTPAPVTPEQTAQQKILNTELGGATDAFVRNIPSEQKLLPPGVITVPNNAGGETVIDANAGPIQGAAVAAVTNSTIAEDIASGIPLKGYAPDQAKAELASRPDAERYEIRPHPVSGDRGRVAIVPKSAQALAEIDAKASSGNEAMARSEQLAAEEGARKQLAQVAKDIQAAQKQAIDLHRSAASIEKSITPSTPPQDAAIAREQATELRSQAAAIQTQIQTARAAATQQATQGVRQQAAQNAPATEQALAQDAAQQELAPAVAQPVANIPTNPVTNVQSKSSAPRSAAPLALYTDGVEGNEIPASAVPNGNEAFQYALGRTKEKGPVAIFRRKASERGTYGGWRWERDAQPAGKASTRRAGESESDWLYRKAAEKNKAKAEQQRPSEPVSEVDAKDLEVVGRAVTPTGDLGLSIIREDAMPDMDKAGPKEVSKQSATFLRHVAKLFGKEIVFVGGMNEDGFYQSGNKIYLSTKSNINQLRVLGHEMLHALKRQNRASYDKLLEAVGAIATDAQLKAQFKDYFALDAEMSQKTDAEIDAWLKDKANRDMVLEEMMADLSGNRFAESAFWESVFTKIDAKYGSEQSKGIIAKLRLALVAALNKLMSLVKGGQFSVDARVSEHLESIREALATGFADYAKAVKDGQISESGVGEVNLSKRKDYGNDYEQRKTVSTTVPTPNEKKKRNNNPITENWVIDTKDIEVSQNHMSAVANAVAKYNTILSDPGQGDDVLADLRKIVVDNLLKLHDMMPPAIRERAKLWYDGANVIAKQWSELYGITDRQAAGVLAVFSPQMDWFKNVSLAERAIAIVKNHREESWSPEMTAWTASYVEAAATLKEREDRLRLLDDAKRLEGKVFKYMSLSDKARFVRVFDETYHERSYRTITPEGGFSDYVTKFEDEGGNADEAMVTWGGFATIEKALSILENGSFKNISEKLGNEHKVRNFYNNIIDPNNADGHVTIDTHAIAASMFKALSGTAVEVSHNFGTTPPGVTGASGNNETGASGTYGLFADAYRDAAAQRGMLAREMQSITWEAVRSLFPASQKKVMQPKIEAVWDKFKAKKINRAEAERQVLEISGGLRPMQWEGHDQGESAADGATSFSHDKAAPRTLPPSNTKEKVTVSMSAYTTSIPALRQLRNMAAKGDTKAHTLLQNIALDAAKEMFKGTSAKIKADFVTGLYGGATEPSLSVAVTFNHAERNEIMARLKQFADTFDQEQVHVLRQAKEKLGHVYQDGSYATPVYRWDLNQALSAKEVAKVIKDSGLYGLTFNDSFVTAYFVDQPSATKKDGTPYTHEEQQDDFTAGAEKARVALGAKVAKAGRSVARLWAYGDRGDGAVGWPGVRSGVSAEQGIRTESVRVAKQYIDATKATPKLSPARYEQPATDGGVAGQDRPSDRRLGQVDVTGTHYSREQREHLSGVFFGTGLNAEEGKRIQEAKDQRLKSRLYAYVNEGQGVFPEAGVGAYAHTVKLDNLYDLKADPLGIRQKTQDANDRESLILDSGFDGYYAPGIFGRQGVAILMGGAATRGVTPNNTVAPAVSASEAQKPARRTDLPLGQMTGAEWKKLEPRATDLEDGKSYYRSDLKFSPARVQSENELPNQQPGNRTLDGAELKALRRAASRLERPADAVFLRVTEDGRAIATGPKGVRVPEIFTRFAKDNDLTFEARRNGEGRNNPSGYPTGYVASNSEPMPVEYREAGAQYFGEGNLSFDRTGKTRFSPAREYISEIEGRIAKIKASDNQGGLSMVEANLANIKRGLAGEIVRDEQGNLLAPNGRKSKLTEKQYLQVRTPAFRKWFGDWLSFHNAKNGDGVWVDVDKAVSKIVDENGEPKVVYHGTEKGGFTTMRPEAGDKHRSPMLFAAATWQTARTYSWKGDEIDLAQPEFAGAVARKIGNDWFVVQKSGDSSEAYNVYGELVDVEQAEGYVSKKEAEYFRDNELEQYLRDRGEVQAGIYSMFLNIRDPIERDFEGANWDGNTNDMFEVLGEDGDNIYADDGRRLMPQDEAEALAEQNEGAEVSSVEWIGETTNTVAEEAKQYGQDGAIIRQVEDDGGRYPGGVLRPDDVFVFFDSNQAKSATQNTGAFSQKNDDLRYSPPRWYFSPLEKAFESAPDRVFATAPQLKLWLAGNKAKLGLKDDEIFWTGINDYLDLMGKQKVSKADVLGYLAGSGVRVEEVMKVDSKSDAEEARIRQAATATNQAFFDQIREDGDRVQVGGKTLWSDELYPKMMDGRIVPSDLDPKYQKLAKDWIDAVTARNALDSVTKYDLTQYSKWQLPGGTNYRELLLTLPEKTSTPIRELLAKKYGKYGRSLYLSATPEEQRMVDAESAQLKVAGQSGFRSSHWQEPNILAHIRMNDRTDADGAKVLFIEEVQSDWGQEGKKKGFGEQLTGEVAIGPLTPFTPPAPLPVVKQGVPNAPFVTDTKARLGLAVKRIMAYAAANGYDKVAFINGEQSADRYDLSKQVDRIGWFKNGNTGRKVMVDLGDVGTAELLTNQEGKIVGTRGARNAFIQAEGRMLDEAIGKEIAAKVMESPEGELSGEGLKVGGEGMKTFYDRIVPQVVSDQLKKVGGKMEAVEIGAIAKSEITEAYGRFYIEHGEDTEVYRTREEAEIAIGSSASLQQPGFTVTPKMSGPLPLFSTRRIVGDSGRQYDQTQRDFFKDVGRDIEQKNLVERTLDFLNKDFSKKMAVGLVDQFRGLRDLGDNGQAYMLARLSKGTAGAFDALLHHGKLSLKNGVYDADTSGGFVQRLGAPLNGELDDFLWYVAANRAEKLMPSDREHLFTPAHIAAGKSLANGTTNWDYTIQTGPQAGTVTRNRSMIFADANRVFNEFQKNTLDMAEQSGLIDGASRKYWESEFYVPFYRVSEEDNEFIGAKMGNALVRQQAFKKLKGGTDKLNSDLLSNTLLNFSHLIEASAKNRAAKASLGAAEQIGAAHKAQPGEKKTVWFMDNGQKVEYKVDDPYVMTAITSLEYAGMRNGIMDALSKFKHWLTIGVTASPAFKVRNLIRDSLQAIGTSNLSYNPIVNVREGFRQTKRDSQEYASALASGALIRFGTMLEGNESARTRQLIRSGVKDSTILNSEGKWQKFYGRVLEPGITAYNELGNRSEEINRAALYNQLIRQGKSHAEAALLARDLMDFSMQGSFNTVRFLTQVVPFMNARLQGMYKLGRASKDNPRKMAVVTGAVAMASIALMLAYEDDDEWKRREPWDRDNYWWFKVGGEEFRIPKPFELGAIASMAERGLEYMINDEMTGERFLKETRNLVLNQLAMNPVPQAVKPIIDLYANKDSFTGRPIESMSMQRLDPTMRYNSNTSMTARAASNAVGGALSPVQVDHLVRGYFAWLGAFVNGGADMAWRAMSNEPTKPTMDYWKFATQGIVQETDSAGSRYVTQVYEQAKELERAHATWKRLIKDGKVEEATAYREDHADELRRYKQVEAVKKIESNLNDRIHRIEISAIDPDLKKEQINNIKRMKEAAAKRISPGAY